MKNYYYFIVEGVHDTAALSRYLKEKDMKLVRNIEQVDSFWQRIIPLNFPYNGDLMKRMPVPTFYENSTHSIAIQTAEGDSGIARTFISLSNLNYEELAGIAIFCDADSKPAKDSYQSLLNRLHDEVDADYHSIFEKAAFGKVTKENMNFGVYVFPDNESPGTLERLLLEGAEIAYPDLTENAKQYVGSIPVGYRKKWKQSSEPKVLFGVMANALKPGKANQVSIQDNDWISNKTTTSHSQVRLRSFLAELLEW